MAESDFTATVNDWVKQTTERQLAVFKQSTQTLVSKMQQRIPVDTGYARSSIVASLDAMPEINPGSRGVKGAAYSYDGSDVVVTIAGATISDTIYVGYTASYVQYLEYGHSNQAPTGFVGISAMEWPKIVEQVSAELKNRTMGSMG